MSGQPSAPIPLAARLAAALAGQYRIERELGAGGMATVWLAHDLKHNRKVAIKVLHPHLAAMVGADRFLKEIQTTANLQHPHILALHDSGDADGLLFYVMPFVDGESLRQRLTREQQLPIADAIRITSEVAGALDYAHRQGVIHRDIKPENILLHEGSALVADFGIALAPVTGDTRLTETGLSLGTPHYMSPEQALGERALDARSDIYAVGAMLYEMLTGAPPFTGPSAQAIVAKVISQKPVPPSRLRKEIPAQVENALLTALQKDPVDRFATMAAFQSALGSPLSGGHVRRRIARRLAWIGGLAAFAFLVTLAVHPRKPERHAAVRPPADTAARRLFKTAAFYATERNGKGCVEAIRLYSEAIDKDSTYAEAYAALAKTHALCALFGTTDPTQEFIAAKNASEAAIRLDSTVPGVYTTRGMMHVFHDQDFVKAEHDFATAIRLDSTQYEPWLFRTWYYFAINNVDSALQSMLHAKELAPTEAIVGTRLSTALRAHGEIERARAEVAAVLQRDPLNGQANSEVLETDVEEHDCPRALQQLPRVTGDPHQYTKASVFMTWALCGRPDIARHYADSMAARTGGDYIDAFSLAMVYATLGDSVKMYRWLDQAVADHNWALFFLGQKFPFRPYRADPRFVALMKRAGVR